MATVTKQARKKLWAFLALGTFTRAALTALVPVVSHGSKWRNCAGGLAGEACGEVAGRLVQDRRTGHGSPGSQNHGRSERLSPL